MRLYICSYLAFLFALTVFQRAGAAEIAALPVMGQPDRPALLLELGTDPPSLRSAEPGLQIVRGELAAQELGATQTEVDEIVSRHPGFGHWSAVFRFRLKESPANQPYTFWARWRQGGEPEVCVQTFELWAGADAVHLERRGEFRLKPKGWDYAWLAAEPQIAFQAGDRVVEVRNNGAGHDAKIFDAFLLGPPPPPMALPVTASAEKPVVLLELGTAPRWTASPQIPGVQVHKGVLTGQSGNGGLIQEKDEVQVLHTGFGEFGASFRFEPKPALPPGQYRFFARYKSGGEVSQVAQTFTLKAGHDAQNLAARGEFKLTNSSPWEYQWLQGEGTIAILPGDRILDVFNAGKADGAKVFDAFLLQREVPLQGWMGPADAELRNRFLARTHAVEKAERRLYVLDGLGVSGAVLFRGLASPSAQSHYDKLSVKYLIGSEAETLARGLNLPSLPVAVVSDDHDSLLGVLASPKSEAEVTRFLADPEHYGKLPAIPALAGESGLALHGGIPAAWLVGGLQDGLAGVSLYGLDTETVLRPNPEQPYFASEMMGGRMRAWQIAVTGAQGQTVVEEATEHDYRWSGGTAYAQLYVQAEHATRAHLTLTHTGIASIGWLDGHALALDQNSELNLTSGWHSLLIKLTMRHDKGQRFAFSARFTDGDGKPLNTLKTRTSDPAVDLALNRVANKLKPLVYVDAPANLPRPGEPLKIRADLRWHPLMGEKQLPTPLPRFRARLRLQIKDYDGREIATREKEGLFPGIATLDLGQTPEAGYYAVYMSLLTPEGKPIASYPADGFTVVRGNAAQRQRLNRKKLWNNYYYAFADGDRAFREAGGYFNWLERMGVFQSYGSYPGFETPHKALWEDARQRGLTLFADTAGDSHWLNDKEEEGRRYIETAAPYTRYFKASNEIDIRREAEWQTLRESAHWVQRARREHEQIHKLRPDGHYVGGSLVRPGDLGDNAGYPNGLGPGKWFEAVLKLGLDQYLDAWDVHAYPQHAPRFGGAIGNADSEDERGVLATYARLGRKNTLPFWLGEAGAKAAHGATGRRWQAEQAAKMVAWINSRADYLGIAFCIAHEYDLGYGRLWDYSMGHKPGEAALYTAGALIDGLPYQAVETHDANVQAATFGPTLVLWRADEQAAAWRLKLDPKQVWVLVDVVGHVRELPVSVGGDSDITLTASPVYVLSRDDYRRLLGVE